MVSQFFKLQQNGVSIRSELFAGLSTFLTMAFIIAVYPAILSDAGIDFGAAFVDAFGVKMVSILKLIPKTLIVGLIFGSYFLEAS